MDTDDRPGSAEIVADLQRGSWREILDGIRKAVAWIQDAEPGDPDSDLLVAGLLALAGHQKWEVRRAIAQAASQIPRPAFEPVMARLMADANARVSQAAHEASLRARDGREAGVFGKEHAERINRGLDSIQAKYGVPGREAVKKAAAGIADVFARELYHEIVKLISPLGAAAQRLHLQLRNPASSPETLLTEATRIATQVKHLEAVLNSMRSYAAAVVLRFTAEPLREVCDQAVHLVQEGANKRVTPGINVSVTNDCVCEIDRSRMVQAVTNLLINAVESYDGVSEPRMPVEIRSEIADGYVMLVIRDSGVGMSPEVLRDAPTLFTTAKRTGTGFGLPLAIKIVESEHGGRLRLTSTKGVGTEVHVVLPRRQGVTR